MSDKIESERLTMVFTNHDNETENDTFCRKKTFNSVVFQRY